MDRHLYDIFAEKWQSDNKQVFFYSDPHFGDLECYAKRGQLALNLLEHGNTALIISEIAELFQAYRDGVISADDYVKAFDELQIKSINRRCGKASTFVCLGDVGDLECVKKLRPRYKVLIMGNHDKGASNYKRVDKHIHKFEYEMLDEDKKYSWKMIDPTPIGCVYERIVSNNLFDEVYKGNLYISDKIKLSHVAAPEAGYINLHGHDHCSVDQFNMAAESICYVPKSLNEIVATGKLKTVRSSNRKAIDRAIARKKNKK